MGLAASQCRLLFLTARKSDLELRAQHIAQRKITLTMESENISNEYARATNARKIMLVTRNNSGDGSAKEEVLTYSRLISENNESLMGTMRLITGDGSLVVNKQDDPVLLKTLFTPNGQPIAYVEWNGAQGIIKGVPGATATSPDIGRTVINVGGALNNVDLFQEALRQGTIMIQRGDARQIRSLDDDDTGNPTMMPDGSSSRVWSNFTWQGNESFNDRSDTSNNAKALAVYETKMARVQRLDKLMDMEMKQVETQQKAAEAEIDSVKKLIDKHIERSFKYFS